MENLRKLVCETLEERFLNKGFVYDDLDKDTIVFRAKKPGGFFLSIGFINSRFDPDIFTVEYFLSKTASHNEWSPLWHQDHDFMPESRIFALLTEIGKNTFFPDERWTPEQIDAWWKVKNDLELVKKLNEIFEIIIECADSFNTKELRNKIAASKGLAERIAFLEEIYNVTTSGKNMDIALEEKLAKKLKVKPELPQIANAVIYFLRKRGEIYDSQLVYNISCDCYNLFFRQYPTY